MLAFYWQGKRYECASSKSQKDADKKAVLKLQALERGEIGISSGMTVKRWAQEWLEVYKRPRVTDKSYKNYSRHVEKVILAEIGNMRISDVTDIHLQKILNTRAGYSYSEAKHLRDTIKAIFAKARATKVNGIPLIRDDPSEFLEMPVTIKGERRSISDFERLHFLRVAEVHPYGLMFKTMLYCGLRPGEIAALSWKDIDFENREINIASAIESGTKEIKGPKTEAGVRMVPLPDAICDALLSQKGDLFAPVFAQVTTGRRHTESSRNKAWKSILRHMDISMGATVYRNKITKSVINMLYPDLVPYCLRHTYCTDLRDAGVDVTVAAKFMGHADVSVTLNIYTHITPGAISKAKEQINAQHSGTRGGKEYRIG